VAREQLALDGRDRLLEDRGVQLELQVGDVAYAPAPAPAQLEGQEALELAPALEGFDAARAVAIRSAHQGAAPPGFCACGVAVRTAWEHHEHVLEALRGEGLAEPLRPHEAAPSDPERVVCEWCGGSAVVGSTCPKSIGCPSCPAGPGQNCRRPSGHPCRMHAPRWEAAEAMDAAAGVTYGEGVG
jgi:hypothetical protein